MARVTVEDCLERVNNHFALVILAAERARQLAGGAPRLVVCTNKPAVTALREIGRGKVAFKEDIDETVRTFVADRKRIDGYMPNELRGELAYKVRPLNGVWATPPYLHNGSVPTVEALLGPPEDRPKKFYLGNREYDPVNLGYKFDKLENGFEFDTTIRGNWNTGHEFRKEYSKEKEIKGVIGPALSPGDRKALIEYLKTL